MVHKFSAGNLQTLIFPPSKCGEIAQYIYNSSIRPVPEVAILATLGLLSGICGRAWQTPTHTGLNNYMALVARSAMGKEALNDGISNLIYHAIQGNDELQAVNQFFTFADFASAPALQKYLSKNKCFANIVGELGQRIELFARSMSRHDPLSHGLLRLITKLYSKSSPTSRTGGLRYSDRTNDVEDEFCVAYSLFGESTPRKFYEALTQDMMEDGFLSRFCVVEYTGKRPLKNLNAIQNEVPPPNILGWLQGLLRFALKLNMDNEFIYTQAIPEAWAMLEAYDQECDNLIDQAGEDESKRQLGNRAYLKVLKISSLLAVADNYQTPCITTEHVQWAVYFIERGNAVFLNHLNSGNVGDGDHVREEKVIAIIKRHLITKPYDEAKALSSSEQKLVALHKAHIIPRRHLQHQTQKVSCFAKHPLQATKALDQTIQSLIKGGILMVVPKTDLMGKFSYAGECYYWVHDDSLPIEKKVDPTKPIRFWPPEKLG